MQFFVTTDELLSYSLGGGVARSDDNVFLFEGDISMNKSEAIKIVQGSSAERRRRAVGNTGSIRLWPKNVPYAISRSLCKF